MLHPYTNGSNFYGSSIKAFSPESLKFYIFKCSWKACSVDDNQHNYQQTELLTLLHHKFLTTSSQKRITSPRRLNTFCFIIFNIIPIPKHSAMVSRRDKECPGSRLGMSSEYSAVVTLISMTYYV